MTLGDRVVGCILGLALGDAVGAPFESRRSQAIPNPLPVLERPWEGGPAGSTTDDTAMARNLVRSLVANRGFDGDDIVRRHVEWLRAGPPDVGSLTRRVLARVANGLDGPGRETQGPAVLAESAARAVWEERGPEVSAGNGSVMYCAPLGACYARSPDALLSLAPRLSAFTHFDDRCRTAVLAVTLAAAAAIRGETRSEAVRAATQAALRHEGGEELEYLIDAVGDERPIDGPDQGFCLFAAAAGLQALAGDEGFERAILHVVALGGDTDTNAAVAGALVGATVGRQGLPDGWLARLVDRPAIQAEGEALAGVAAAL